MRLYILVDASYFCFFRYHALLQWWRNAKPEQQLEVPIENEEFVTKFREIFVSKLKELPMKVAKLIGPEGIKMTNAKFKELFDTVMWVGRDCRRQEIWRMELYPKYKATRDYSNFQGGPLFQLAYSEQLFEKGGADFVMKAPHLEADDCIAMAVEQIRTNEPDAMIVIIASDHDYLQLTSPAVRLVDLKYTDVSAKKGVLCDSRRELFNKTLMGDTSDNIPAAFPKCGPKTAERCYTDVEYMKKLLDKHEGSREQLALNARLIDMKYIPRHLTAGLIDDIKIRLGLGVK